MMAHRELIIHMKALQRQEVCGLDHESGVYVSGVLVWAVSLYNDSAVCLSCNTAQCAVSYIGRCDTIASSSGCVLSNCASVLWWNETNCI